ncbi:LysR family transcriptional regulator [Kribbella italica]|uniref:DNA-binding transcriptional LysR family regulator n=1 Tax=Kribbella italica TaxID=1540520 RepID=A0A7W9J4X0_9ACTN|nr:LysR family transcriptional regulator [Kribbella italica]MBB5835669.1 DNA-binding transcriptional LysR family regulator [Kribbella italica]
MLSLTQLGILVRVVDEGSFSAAAKVLYMSQPAVSNHIRALERSLGVGLVQRGPHGAQPTPAGTVVVGHAREVFGLLERLEHAAAGYRGLEAGQLVVAGTTTLGTYLVPRLIGEFAARAPKVSCQIRVGNEDTVESWLMLGEVGLGLCAGTPTADALVSEPLLTESLVLVAGPGFPLAGRPVSTADLAEQRFLLREQGSATRRLQEQSLRDWNLDKVETWDLWGPDTVKEAVQQGLGLAVLSEHAVRREVDAGFLVCLDVQPPPPSREVSLVRRADRLLTPPEEAFAALVRATAEWPH